ncbi:hypothetical protein FRC12_009301 [Ceratobasidium sp. 428]|nr:hypothetical protein FRC12_009301 [Ceratobasidium sp. 428]
MSSNSKALDAHAIPASAQSYDGTHSRGGVATTRHQRVSRVKVTFTNAGNPAPCHTFHRNKPEVLLVGRDAADECGVLAAPSRENMVPLSVSKRHARIVWKNGKLRVVDLGSQNGTYFQDGARRLEPYAAHLLTDGSIIWFGQYGEAGNRLHEPLIAKVVFVLDGEPALENGGPTQSYSDSCSLNHDQMVQSDPKPGSQSECDASGSGPTSRPAYDQSIWDNRANSDDSEFEYIGSDPACEGAQGIYSSKGGCMLNRSTTESLLSGKKRKREEAEGSYDDEPGQSEGSNSESLHRAQNDEESSNQPRASDPRRTPSPKRALTEIVASTVTQATTPATTPMPVPRPTKRFRTAGCMVLSATAMWCYLAFT